MRIGADRDREEHGPDADRASEQPAGEQGRQLDAGTDDPDRVTAAGDAGHDAVAGARTEARADVETDAGPGQSETGDEHRPARRRVVGGRQTRQHEIDHDADDDRVGDRADPDPLSQRDPPEQYDEPDEHRDGPDRDARAVGEAEVQHVPRIDAEIGADRQREGHAAQHEPGHQTGEASTELAPRREGEQLAHGFRRYRRGSPRPQVIPVVPPA